MAGTYNIEYESLAGALEGLRGQSPEGVNESTFFETASSGLTALGANHDDCFSACISSINELSTDFLGTNEKYVGLMTTVDTALTAFKQADQNGGVDREQPAGGGVPSGGGTGGTPGYTPPVDISTTPQIDDPTTPATGTGDAPVGGEIDASSPGLSGGDPVGGSAAAGAGAAAGAIAGTQMIESGGLGGADESGQPIVANNPMGDHPIPAGTYNNLTDEEKENLRNKLRELGYSDSEISQILGGGATVPEVSVENLAGTLEQALADNPGLRDELINKYGFDIFNPDGTVNRDRLALALLMDGKNGQDDYSMIDLLHSQYGIDVVNQTDFINLTGRLEQLLVDNPDLREKLISRYGFDIFNPDGSVNRDKLALAMLMDGKNPSDEYDLMAYLTELYGEDTANALLGNIQKPVKIEPEKKSGVGAASVIAGVGLLGAAGAGTAYALKKKEDDEEESDELEEDASDLAKDLEKIKPIREEKQSNKEWLYGLGIGVGAAAAAGAAGAKLVNQDDEENELDDAFNSSVPLEKIKPVENESKPRSILPFLGIGLAGAAAGKVVSDELEKEEEKTVDKDDEF